MIVSMAATGAPEEIPSRKPPRGLRELKKNRTRQELAQITVDLVRERGLGNVRIPDVCERAQVGRSTFFRYFESKESAFVEGVHAGRRQALLEALDARPATESPFEALRAAFLAIHRDWRTHREILLLTAEIRRTSPHVQAWAAMQGATWTQSLATALTPRFADPTDADLRAGLLAGAAVAAVGITSDIWLNAGADTSPEQLVSDAFGILGHLEAL